MQNKKVYTVNELFDVLKANKITSNIESVRRWLRQGEIEGIAPTSRKEGWTVTHEALKRFLAKRLPENITFLESEISLSNTTNVAKKLNETNVALNEEKIRANMWFEVTRKNIWEGYVQVKKNMLKDAAEHRHYAPALIEEVWNRCVTNSSEYKQPRVNYLLDAFSFEGNRLKLNTAFESKEEQIIYAIFEYVKKH